MLDTPLRITQEIPKEDLRAPSLLEAHVRALNPVIPSELDPSVERRPVLPEETRQALNELVCRRLPLILTLTSLLFAFLVAYRWGFHPDQRGLATTSLIGLTALILFALRLVAGFIRLRASWSHPLATLIAGLLLANCLLHLQIASSPKQVTFQAIYLILLTIGAGCVFLSVPWLSIALMGVAGVWLSYLIQSTNLFDTSPLSFGLMGALALCWVVHGVRLKAYREVLTSRLEEKGRRERLECLVDAARQSDERYRRFSMATIEGIAVHAKGNILDANEALVRLFGYSSGSLTGRRLQDLLAADSRSMLAEIFELGSYQSVEAVAQRQDGSQFPVEIFNSIIPGEETHHVTVFRDITERKMAERSLNFERQKQEQLYQRQIALANLDIASYTPDNLRQTYSHIVQLAAKQLQASLGACLVMRLSESDLWELVASTIPGQSVPVPLPAEWLQPNSLISWMIDHREMLEFPDLSTDPLKTTHLFPNYELNAFLAAPLLLQDRLIGILMILDHHARIYSHEDSIFCTGLTSRTATLINKVQLYEQLRHANQLLEHQSGILIEQNRSLARAKEASEKANQTLETQQTQLQDQNQALAKAKEMAVLATRAKSEFLANISHELCTPMNGILGMTSLLQISELTSEQKDYVETLSASAEKLHQIINTMLKLAQMEQGELALESENFNLASLVESIIGSVSPQAQNKSLELISWIDEDIPPLVRGAASGIKQVLTHLIDNAIKFTHQGEVLVNVTRENETNSQVELRFLVHDTGIGIAPQILPDLFQPFHQADGADTRQHEGAGLGLVLSKRIVQLMQGQIGVDSTLEEGSDFWFTIHLEKPSCSPPPPPSTHKSLEGQRGLVIHTNATYRLVLQRLMTYHKMRTQGAADQTEALRLLRQESKEPFQVIILDAQDKGMADGELLAALPQERPPRLLWLTHSDAPWTPSLPAAVPSASITKPIRQSQFIEEMANLLAIP